VMSTVRKESSMTALKCALHSDGSAKQTVKF